MLLEKKTYLIPILILCSSAFANAQTKDLTEQEIKGIALLINDLDYLEEENQILKGQLSVMTKQLEATEHSLSVCGQININNTQIINSFNENESLYQDKIKALKRANIFKIIAWTSGGVAGGFILGSVF